MRIRQPGKIYDNLWFLGREESCVYLLEGTQESMLISAGMSYLVPDILAQLEDFEVDERRIKKILILHAHFDHVGIVPFFKRRHPDVEIYGSARAWELLKTPKVIETINRFSREVAKRMGREGVYAKYDLDWRKDIAGTAVHEGDRLDLGAMEVRIYETPGHSSCSITAYAPTLQALFASDGGGIPFKESIITSGNSNFTEFQRSLEKLRDLKVRYVCADHYGYIAGDEAPQFIGRAIGLAGKNRARMEEAYRRTGSIEAAARDMVEAFYKDNPKYLLTREIFEGVYRQMVRHVANALGGQPSSS
jgi:glyoxylase-like metal-dependent hydrolase (beta-lactamase superfamily II)